MLENYNYQIVLTALEFLSAKGIVITGGGTHLPKCHPQNREMGIHIHGHGDKCESFGFSEQDRDLIFAAFNSTL